MRYLNRLISTALLFFTSLSLADTALQSCGCDTNEIQINQRLQALAALPTGGVLTLAPGIFKTSSPIYTMPGSKNIYIIGAGKGATVIRPASTWMDIGESGGSAEISGAITFVSTSHFGVSNLTVDYQTYNPSNSANGIVASDSATAGGMHSSYGEIANVEILGNPGHHYLIWSFRAQHMLIHDNVINGNQFAYDPGYDSAGSSGTDHNGIEIAGGSDIVAYGNSVNNMAGAAFWIGSITGVPDQNISNIHFFNNTADSVSTLINFGTNYDTVAGASTATNIIFNHNSATNVWKYGIWGSHGTGSISAQPVARNVLFDGNVINMATTGGSTSPKGLHIAGFGGFNYLNFLNYRITNNLFNGVSASTASISPLNDISFVNNVDVIGNNFNSGTLSSTGYYTGLYITTSDNIKIDSNTINKANSNAIAIQSVSNFEVVANTLLNWALRTGDTGSSAIDFGDGISTKGLVANNRFHSSINTYSAIYDGNSSAVNQVDFIENNFIDSTQNGGLYALGNTTDSNIGTFTLSAASSYILSNSRIRAQSMILIEDATGTNTVTKITPSQGSATITFSSQNSDTFRYRIMN